MRDYYCVVNIPRLSVTHLPEPTHTDFTESGKVTQSMELSSDCQLTRGGGVGRVGGGCWIS